MVVGALVVLLFLLGFGFMILSHANREIHLVSKRVGLYISIFIIFFTSIMILYLSAYLFTRGIIHGESPFAIGTGPVKGWLTTFGQGSQGEEKETKLGQYLQSLNTILQRQALEAASTKKVQIESELKDLKKELKLIKKEVSSPKQKTVRIVRRPRTYSRRSSSVYTRKVSARTVQPKTITNLVGYDPSKYTPETEPVLKID